MAGEKSGSLEQVIRRYVRHVKVVAGVQPQDVSALIYPAVLLALSMVVVGIIVLQVVPEFAAFYEQFGGGAAALDADHRRDLDIRRTHLCLALIVRRAGGAGVGSWLWLQRPGNREAASTRGCCGCRTSGPLARKFATAQVSRTLATLLGGGIPLVNALDIAARSIGNRYMAGELLDGVRSRCGKGARWRRR